MQQYQEQLPAYMTQIPDDVARVAHEQHLGAPEGSYTITELRKGWRWSPAILTCAALCPLLWVGSSVLKIDDYLMKNLFLAIMIPLFGMYTLMMAGIIAIKRTRRMCTLYSCDGGLILRQSLKNFRVIRWEEIETMWQTTSRLLSMGIVRNNLYALRCHDGDILTFGEAVAFSNHLKIAGKLAPIFEDQFTRRRLPFQLADYQAGQMLHFGPLSIDRNRIAVGEKTLPWEEVADITLLKGRRLVIYKTGERQEVWLSLPAFKIDNLSILLALFKRIRSGQTEQEVGLQVITTAYGAGTTIVPSRRNKIDSLPDELAALAEEHILGERRLDQQLGRSLLTSWARIITMSIISVILLIVMIVPELVFILSHSLNRSDFIFEPFIFLALYAFLFMIVMIIGLIQSLQQIHNHTYTFERGLILKRDHQSPIVVRWEEIEFVWRAPIIKINRNSQPTVLPRVYAYMLQLRDSSKYTLTRLDMRMDTLGNLIKEQIVPLQLPAAIDVYQTGQTLIFGAVHINLQGITVGERSLPWSQVKSVTLQENKLVIFDIAQRQPWGKVKARGIPNLFLLFELTDYARNSSFRAE